MGTKFFYRDIDLVYFVNNKLINSCTSTAYPLPLQGIGITERYAPDLINQKDRILLSFSGGQDSICFVFILNQLYCQLELDITFFWCHHLWQTDSFYLMQQIAKLSFLFQFPSCFPIPLSCISSELLARKWRQSCSYRVSLFYNYSKMCLAHTFNDKIENIFLNFIRGTGLIGLTPLRWIQLTKCISKPNIILNNFINTAYSFFCIPPSGVNGKQRKGNGLQIKDLYLLRHPLQVASPHISLTQQLRCSFPYKSSDKSSSLNPLQIEDLYGVSFATCKGLRLEDLSEDLYGVNCTSIRRTPLFLCRRTNSSCVIIDSKRNNQVIVLTNKRSLPFRGYGGMVPTKWNRYHNNLVIPPAIAFSLRGDTCAIARENPTKKYISQHKYLKLTPYKSSDKSSSLNPLQVAKLTSYKSSICKGLRLEDLSEDLYGVSPHVRHPPQRIPLRHPVQSSGVSCASTVTCKEYALEGNVMCGLNTPLSKAWGKQLRDGCYIVRPLLAISRIELNKICYFWELPIYPDKSNQKVKFLRNRVRGQLLPTIKLFFNLNIENIFLQLAKIIEAEDYCLTQIVNEFIKNTDVYHTKLDIYSKRKNN